MAAIAFRLADPWVTGRPARPGPPDRTGAQVYRRRRAVAVCALVTVVAVLLVVAAALRLALAGPGGGALTTSGPSGASPSSPVSARLYVVQPGDTLWSIIRATSQTVDPRPEVDRLALELGGRPLLPGQRLLLP